MLPPSTGIVSFLFSDIEGSTRLWEDHPDAMRPALSAHDEVMRNAIESNDGFVFKTIGDAFCAAFAAPLAALNAALAAQQKLQASQSDSEEVSLRVRMALHSGNVEFRDKDYFGPPLNRVARLLSAAHGEQTLLSAETHDLLGADLPDGASLLDLGEHRLRDLRSGRI